MTRLLSLLEDQILHHDDTRWAPSQPDGYALSVTIVEKADDTVHVIPRYWVVEAEVDRQFGGRCERAWPLGWCDGCRANEARSVMSTSILKTAIPHKVLIALPDLGRVAQHAVWPPRASGHVPSRNLGGTSMAYLTFMQLPLPSPQKIEHCTVPFGVWAKDWNSKPGVDRLKGRPSLTQADDRAIWPELDPPVRPLCSRDWVEDVQMTFSVLRSQHGSAIGDYNPKPHTCLSQRPWGASPTDTPTFSITVEAR